MATKLDKNYVSIYTFIQGLVGVAISIDTQELNGLDQLKGSFQPFADMVKDAADTFKPYRSRYYVKRDAKQPIYGAYNLLKGLLYLIALIPLLFVGLGFCIFTRQSERLPFGAVMLLSWFIDGILSIFRGITQIAFTPLVLAKMAIRGFIWAVTSNTELLVENRKGIRKLIADAQKINDEYKEGEDKKLALNKLSYIVHYIGAKYNKGIERGEDTAFNGQIRDEICGLVKQVQERENKFALNQVQVQYTIVSDNKKNDKEPVIAKDADSEKSLLSNYDWAKSSFFKLFNFAPNTALFGTMSDDSTSTQIDKLEM